MSVSGTSFEDTAVPADDEGFYYVVALGGDCSVASWQTALGEEPDRDANLP